MKSIPIDDKTRERVVKALQKTPMFRMLMADRLGQIVDATKLVEFEAGEPLVEQGQASDSFLFLFEGAGIVRMERGGEAINFGRVQPPELLGVVGLVLEEPRVTTVIAGERSQALIFEAKSFNQMLAQIPGFAQSITREMAGWLKQLSGQIPLPRSEAAQPPPSDILGLLPVGFLQRHRVLPMASEGKVLTMGFVDDPTSQVLSGAQQLLPGMEIQPVRIDAQLFNETMASYGGVEEWQIGESAAEPYTPSASSPALDRMIERMASEGASDLHLSAGRKPRWRIDGRIVEIGDANVLGPEDVLDLFKPVLDERYQNEFTKYHDVDFGYTASDVARVRVNLYRERHGVCAAMRLISNRLMSFEQLGLPDTLRTLGEHPKGLVLVTGPTGSGKSTTLAAMIDHINSTRELHILTLEDPIEFIHQEKSALITQREIGSHTTGFNRALRAALREDPDVLLVGEMRDRETIQLALEAANTGHLVFSTLHTASTVSTVDRVVDMFPADQQNQVRSSLSETLLGVVSQTLCRRIGGGRVAAVEILVVNHAVGNLIKEGKTNQLPSAIQTGRREGMQMLNDGLAELVKAGTVERKEALACAVDKKDLERRLGAGPPGA